jgi:RecB family exonuclease
MKKTKELLSLYRDQWNDEVIVLGVEEEFHFQIEGLPDFMGFIDTIQQMPTGEIVVVDLKTAARKPSEFQIRNNDQITAYSLGIEALGFVSESTCYRLDYLMKTAKSELVRYGTERTSEDNRRFLKTTSGVWRAIQEEIWFPKPDWYCASCQYQTACAQW